tara:strand:+ start:4256 stop:5230 length:975 start_codon:yes stop_codon:yes gene_type:complete
MPSTHWIGFDLGGTKMMASLLDRKLNVLGSLRKSTKGHAGADQGLERIIDLIAELLDEHKLDKGAISGIGMACPGVVNSHKGILRHAPNLGWKETPIGKVLKAHFKVPVHVLNDVDAGAYGEYAHGAGKGASTLVAVFPGTGIGGGCVINGKLLTGKNASCMEIGNLRILSAGLTGKVGEPPNIESIASRLGIASAAAAEAYRGNAPHLLEDGGTDIQTIKSGSIAKAIKAGDQAIGEIVENAAHYLGISIAGVVDLLGPDVIVLGGGLVEKLPGIFLDGVRNAIQRYASPALAEEVEVREAKLGDDAVVVGAAAYARANAEAS